MVPVLRVLVNVQVTSPLAGTTMARLVSVPWASGSPSSSQTMVVV